MGSGPHGFGQRVTGCGEHPKHVVEVRTWSQLEDALEGAESRPRTRIVVADKIDGDGDVLCVAARDLTLCATPGAKLVGVRIDVDGTKSDNVVFQDLTLTPTGTGKGSDGYRPADGFHFLTPGASCDKGFWIDHCTFAAFPDQCVQTYTATGDAEQLRLSISHCAFFGNPHWHDQGSVEISGWAPDGPGQDADDRPGSGVHVSLYRNYFHRSRRRAPRSSEGCFVHAWNNVLVDWGSAKPHAKQSNGMEAGNNGLLAAVANWFEAGEHKQTIEVAGGNAPARLQFETGGEDTNEYRNDAQPPSPNTDLGINERYEALGLRPPRPARMHRGLRDEIEREAGAPTGG